MRAVVVYESMFGNTHVIADHIADGLRAVLDGAVEVLPVGDATSDVVADAELLVVGGPTHVHGMSSQRSREGARDMADKDDDLHLDPDAEGPGLRDWFDALTSATGGRAAAFDTRVHATVLLTGQASKGIAKRLRGHGYELVVEPESFFVDKEHHLEPDEAARAETWGRSLAEGLREC
jgi:hypothetical protein